MEDCKHRMVNYNVQRRERVDNQDTLQDIWQSHNKTVAKTIIYIAQKTEYQLWKILRAAVSKEMWDNMSQVGLYESNNWNENVLPSSIFHIESPGRR